MPRSGIRTNSCAARSRVSGPICHQTPKQHMKRNPIAPIAAISLAGLLIASLANVFTASPAVPAAQAGGTEAQLDVINQYCVGCHNDRAKTGGVSFQGLTPAGIGEHADVFEKAVRKLRGRVMPPPGSKQPDQK